MITSEIKIKDGITKMYALPEKDLDLLLSNMKLIEVPAKTFLIKNGQVSDKLYFISKGCACSYYNSNEQGVTLWLGLEGDFITCFKSWICREPGHENIQVIEDCILYYINYNDLDKLTLENPQINYFYRKILEDGFVYWESRITMLLFKSAKERYNNLLSRYPLVMQRWPLKSVASYLGITPETLSRLRAEK